VKLIICAGERIESGWTTHDVQPLPDIDICCEFYELPKYVEKNSVEIAKFTHALEHFPMNESVKVLKTINSLMRVGGELYIEVPNLTWNAEELVRNPRSRQNVEYVFGGQHNKWDFHYNGFTPEILAEDLREAGFEIVSLKPYSSIECWAVKDA